MTIIGRMDMEAASSSLSVQQSKNPCKVASLLNHLRFTFWESYQHLDRAIIVLPPSLERAEKSDLESAIWKLGLELQKDMTAGHGSGTSSNLVMTRHLAYVDFLQRAGMYRSLMALTKWHLMAIGQEIAAFQAVLVSQRHKNMERMKSAKPPAVKVPALIPIWTSKPTIQKVLHKQLSQWNEHANKDAAASSVLAVGNELEVIVLASLQS